MRKRSEAIVKLQEALKLYQERLGKHTMTVRALKEIGDFFLSDNTRGNLEKALTHYKEALNIMKYLGMENNKNNINILKNYGVCAMKKGNYHEAMEYLEGRPLLLRESWKSVTCGK